MSQIYEMMLNSQYKKHKTQSYTFLSVQLAKIKQQYVVPEVLIRITCGRQCDYVYQNHKCTCPLTQQFHSGIYSSDKSATWQNDICTRSFIAAQAVIVKDWKQLRCPSKGKVLYVLTKEHCAAINKIKTLFTH